MLGLGTLRSALSGFRDAGSLLIKRGTVMGPLVPLLFIALVLLLAAYLFREVAVIHGAPVFSAVFGLAALWIVFRYLYHYASFAKRDPDRLQSEEYRLETSRMQMFAAKELPYPMPAESLPLAEPAENPAEQGASTEGEDGPESAEGEGKS